MLITSKSESYTCCKLTSKQRWVLLSWIIRCDYVNQDVDLITRWNYIAQDEGTTTRCDYTHQGEDTINAVTIPKRWGHYSMMRL